MKKNSYLLSCLLLLLPLRAAAQDDLDAIPLSMFQPLPASAASPANPLTPEKVALGKKLYYDPILSKTRTVSCNTCHDLHKFGVDNEPTSGGHDGRRGERNSPTVLNSALHFVQFWDGRAATVEEQALGPIRNPIEMGMGSDEEALSRIKESPAYQEEFKKAFPAEASPVFFINIGKAIGAFERTLLTPARFDDYLRGDKKTLSPDEKKGLKAFVSSGCTVCHSGALLGGHMFQKLGLVKPYETKDLGRYLITKNEGDKFFFKVPSLRNIEKTHPYFHDGSVRSLEDAVKIMAEYQFGRTLGPAEAGDIVTFLKTLTGKVPAAAL